MYPKSEMTEEEVKLGSTHEFVSQQKEVKDKLIRLDPRMSYHDAV